MRSNLRSRYPEQSGRTQDDLVPAPAGPAVLEVLAVPGFPAGQGNPADLPAPRAPEAQHPPEDLGDPVDLPDPGGLAGPAPHGLPADPEARRVLRTQARQTSRSDRAPRATQRARSPRPRWPRCSALGSRLSIGTGARSEAPLPPVTPCPREGIASSKEFPATPDDFGEAIGVVGGIARGTQARGASGSTRLLPSSWGFRLPHWGVRDVLIAIDEVVKGIPKLSVPSGNTWVPGWMVNKFTTATSLPNPWRRGLQDSALSAGGRMAM